MVKNSSDPQAGTQADLPDENGSGNSKDCHNIVKSSGLTRAKRRLCCEHRQGLHRLARVSVACQTDYGGLWGSLPEATSSTQCTSVALTSSPRKDDGSRSEGTLRLMIQNFRNMSDTVRGPGKLVSGVPWKIMVMPRQHVVAKKGTQKCLGFFLQCCPDSYSDSWSCQASAELRLISQKPGVANFVRKTTHLYTAKENDWGYSCFMTWADILEENQGYMKDEKVILEVYVKAEQPKGILTHEAFCKKIEDYMRLAEMQSSRSLVDKAIEVNSTALKFCKDKDEEMKAELEKQRQRLIEMKLKESIERIEKGNHNGPDSPDDQGTNMNTLKQALTGTVTKKSPTGGNASQGTQSQKTPPSNNSQPPSSKKTGVTPPPFRNKSKDDSCLPNLRNGKRDLVNGTEDWKSLDVVKLPKERREEDGEIEEVNDGLGSTFSIESDNPYSEEPSCSDEEDDSEAEEEFCDSCLQEKLETISGEETGTESREMSIQTSESGCQTDTVLLPPKRQSPVGAPGNQVPPAIRKEILARKAAGGGGATDTTLSDKEREEDAQMTEDMLKVRQILEGNRDGPGSKTWSREKEQELLDLITSESRASLDSIRDTLERLVSLARDGEVPVGLERELENLRSEQQERELLNTPFVEIPALPVPPHPQPPPLPPPNPPPARRSVPKQAARRAQPPSVNNNNNPRKTVENYEDVKRALEEEGLSNTWDLQPLKENLPEYTEDEYKLIQHAKEIVEYKASELVNKYSQLIEHSEATKLAETVKKVEKRMKDIEKQTMTCRKELSDECERHSREEAKLIKVNKQLKTQVEKELEKSEKINNQLKEKKAEVRKLEKKLKAESATSSENAELLSRVEGLEKDLSASQKKLNEESKRLNRDSQHWNETKRQLQQELTAAGMEIERLNTLVEEKTNHNRKIEHKHDQERRQTQASLREAMERAKKAEVNLLEFKLEIGIKMLQQAQDDCQNNMKHLEDMFKRYGNQQSPNNMKSLQSYILEWQKTRDKISELINKAKSDFGGQIESVKSGKALASLPAIEVPKPPPPPRAQTFAPQNFEMPKQPIGPIGARPGQNSQENAYLGGHNQSLTNGPSCQDSISFTSPAVQMKSQHQSPPGGGVPQLVSATSLPPTSSTHSQPGMRTPPPVLPDALPQNGFSPWSDPLSNLTESLFSSRSTGLSALDNWGSPTQYRPPVLPSGPSLGSGTSPVFPFRIPTSQPPPPISLPHHPPQHQQQMQQGQQQNSFLGGSGNIGGGVSNAGGQWGVGWGYQQVTTAPIQSPIPSGPTDKNFGIRPLSRGSPPGMDSRGSSPITAQNERHKRVETLMEQLQATFPSHTPDLLRDFVNEFRASQPGKTLKGLSVEQAVNGIVSLIMNRTNKIAGWKPSTQGSPLIPSSVMNLDTFAPVGVNLNPEVCLTCGEHLHGQKNIALKCRHRFHTKCVKDWLNSQQTCPTCGKYAPSPEEYPELS